MAHSRVRIRIRSVRPSHSFVGVVAVVVVVVVVTRCESRVVRWHRRGSYRVGRRRGFMQ